MKKTKILTGIALLMIMFMGTVYGIVDEEGRPYPATEGAALNGICYTSSVGQDAGLSSIFLHLFPYLCGIIGFSIFVIIRKIKNI